MARPFDEILLRVLDAAAQGTPLDPRDREELRLYAREMGETSKIVSSWLGESGTDPIFNTLRAEEIRLGKAVLRSRAVRVKRDNTQPIDSATDTFIQFESKGYDDARFVDLDTDNETITIPATGRYIINFFVRWDGNITGYRSAIIQRNGTNFAPIDHRMAVTGQITTNAGYDERWMAAGDTLKLLVKQNSGGSLDIINGAVVVRQVRTVEHTGEVV